VLVIIIALAAVVGMRRLDAQRSDGTSAAGGAATSNAATATRWDAWSPIDNPHVHVRAMTAAGPSAGALPEVRVWLDGHAQYLAPGARAESYVTTTPGRAAGVIVTQLEDTHIPPHANGSTYPLAFPRPGSKKLIDNDRVLVWDYSWTRGVPTPMHFHDKDVVVTYLADGALRSTEPNGTTVVNPHYFGFTKFNAGDRTHTEELIRGTGRAIIIELKR
jgi:hypothetical protein